jgi:hypothetical protein
MAQKDKWRRSSAKRLGEANIFSSPFTARQARVMLPLALFTTAGASLVAKRLCASGDPDGQEAWAAGLGRTPPYVPRWRRPANIAQGKAQGVIPKSAISFETGNGGNSFDNLSDWIEACNAADVAGAIETSVTTGELPRSYIHRGLYGAGDRNVKIRWTGRTGQSHGCWLYAHVEDVIIRGIDFDSFDCVIGVTYPTLPLKKESGEVDPNPYHTATEPICRALMCSPGGAAEGLHTRRLGRITAVGSFQISGVSIRRQMARKTHLGGPKNNFYFDDVAWEAALEQVELVAGLKCTSIHELAKEINGSSADTGYGALINSAGELILTPHDASTPAVIEIMVNGDGAITTDVRSPSVDISHCSFTDTNAAFGAILDVTELGRVTFCGNDMPGTWSGVAAFVTRWSDIFFANNHWHDCWEKRPAATGRRSSYLPAGSSMTAFNTACYVGVNSPVMMRYHRGGNTALIENNLVENVESLNNNDNVNCAVLSDVRNGWQSSADEKLIRFAYNHIRNLKGLTGAGDCNVFYGKLRGFAVVGNRLEKFGAEAKPKSPGSEAAAVLFKNPGPYNARHDGSVAEPALVCGNEFIDGPAGQAWVKVDEALNNVVVDNNLFRNWNNRRLGKPVEQPPLAGLIRITAHQMAPRITRNRFENVGYATGEIYYLISLWNLSPPEGTFDFGLFEVSNNILVSDDVSPPPPVPKAMSMILLQVRQGMPDNIEEAMGKLGTGGNKVLSPDGDEEADALIRLFNNDTAYKGNEKVADEAYERSRYLRAYGRI